MIAFLAAAVAASNMVTGSYGQSLEVSSATIKSGSTITITGKGFDPKIGIYLALCKVPAYGELPTPCGGGVDMTGKSKSSIWISSNAPSYGKNLAQKFRANGSFKYRLKLKSNFLGVDCKKTECAITVRADHTRSQDRNHDLFIPIKFK